MTGNPNALRIREVRLAMGLSLGRFAALVGTNRENLSGWEKGKAKPFHRLAAEAVLAGHSAAQASRP